LKVLYPDYPAGRAIPAGSRAALPKLDLDALAAALAAGRRDPSANPTIGGSGAHSAFGQALLANDTIWDTRPPGRVSARSRFRQRSAASPRPARPSSSSDIATAIAWGFHTTGSGEDLYVETPDPPTCITGAGGSLPFETARSISRCATARPTSPPHDAHGPVISDFAGFDGVRRAPCSRCRRHG